MSLPILYGEDHPRWKGGRQKTNHGYWTQIQRGHPRADKFGRVLEHILVVERVLGRHLPAGAVVHHINGTRDDNRPENLLVCPDELYHKQLHKRKRAFEATGDPDSVKCSYCKQWGPRDSMYVYPKKDSITYHRACSTEANRQYALKRKTAQEVI